jgi:hypothetical protein
VSVLLRGGRTLLSDADVMGDTSPGLSVVGGLIVVGRDIVHGFQRADEESALPPAASVLSNPIVVITSSTNGSVNAIVPTDGCWASRPV